MSIKNITQENIDNIRKNAVELKIELQENVLSPLEIKDLTYNVNWALRSISQAAEAFLKDGSRVSKNPYHLIRFLAVCLEEIPLPGDLPESKTLQ